MSLSLCQAEGTQETVSHNALLCPAGNQSPDVYQSYVLIITPMIKLTCICCGLDDRYFLIGWNGSQVTQSVSFICLASPEGPVEKDISLKLPKVFVEGSAKASLSVLGENYPSVLQFYNIFRICFPFWCRWSVGKDFSSLYSWMWIFHLQIYDCLKVMGEDQDKHWLFLWLR